MSWYLCDHAAINKWVAVRVSPEPREIDVETPDATENRNAGAHPARVKTGAHDGSNPEALPNRHITDGTACVSVGLT